MTLGPRKEVEEKKEEEASTSQTISIPPQFQLPTTNLARSALIRKLAEEIAKEDLRTVMALEKEQENNADLSLAVASINTKLKNKEKEVEARNKEAKELRKANKELEKTNMALLEDLKRRESQIERMSQKRDKYQKQYEDEKAHKDLQASVAQSSKLALENKEKLYEQAHKSATESVEVAWCQQVAIDTLKRRVADQARQLDSFLENPMLIPSIEQELVTALRAQNDNLREKYETEQTSKSAMEEALHKAKKDQEVDLKTLNSALENITKEVLDLLSQLSKVERIQSLTPREKGEVVVVEEAETELIDTSHDTQE
ncbi:hypothetical protein GOP47_0025937 [Adiantum capillus-veneris]|uniref:Uncharacterized protein n=1 Tax=Adiantum capillus-veneris TaxID=13818 RepID=A0A9D4Z2J6_ADICA|nr:hypothetical protein GOP47_0025937 [Adiantum capillus-veneris]